MQTYSLVDCSIGVDGSGIILNELAYTLNVQSDQPDGTPVGTVTLHLNNQLGFNIFQGRLLGYRRDFTGEISPIDIDYPHDLDQAVLLQEANLLVRITNEIGFEAEFHGEIFAKNYSTLETRSIEVMDSTEAGLVPYMAAPATAEGPQSQSIIFPIISISCCRSCRISWNCATPICSSTAAPANLALWTKMPGSLCVIGWTLLSRWRLWTV